MREKQHKIWMLLILFFAASININYANNIVTASSSSDVVISEELNVKELILGHLADSYEWHIWSNGEMHVALSLPVILHSKSSGWHFFSSSNFNHGNSSFNNFKIATEGEYKGKIVESDELGNELFKIWKGPKVPGSVTHSTSPLK